MHTNTTDDIYTTEMPFGLTWHMDVGSAKLNFMTLQEKMKGDHHPTVHQPPAGSKP